ncbi:hypothetical protein [Acinetobacter higginsii]
MAEICFPVHGGIRHLEIRYRMFLLDAAVHGGIRHLENIQKDFIAH